MATRSIVFAILCSTALGEFDLESLPAEEPTTATKDAKHQDTVKDSSRMWEEEDRVSTGSNITECLNEVPATCEISGGPFDCPSLLHHLEELEEEKYHTDEFCGLSWSYIDGCSDTPGLVKDTCGLFCGICAPAPAKQCMDVCLDKCKCEEEPAECCEDEPVRCTEGQIKCGRQDIDPEQPHCPPDDICVSEDCECPARSECDPICEVNCARETQIMCSQPPNSNGCPQNNICVEKGNTTDGTQICDGFCPEECEEDELQCPIENLPNGCKQPDMCILKPPHCLQQHCPFTCTDPQCLCIGGVDDFGCKEVDMCVPREINEEGELCPCTCPVTCENDEILCEGPKINGCRGQDVCHKKAKDYDGVFCPPDSASHECPKTCLEDEWECPPFVEPNGCKSPQMCVSKSKGNNGKTCSSESVCPVQCKPNEYPCPSGWGEDGCKLLDKCIEKEVGDNGEPCPEHCPEICDHDQQIFCEGHIDDNGCKYRSSCINKGEHEWGPGSETDPKAKCPGFCPVQCEADEILCPSQVDPCNGCPTGEVCHAAVTDKVGLFCPGKEIEGTDLKDTNLRKGGSLSYSHGCEKLCKDDEVLCPAYENENGCKPEAECVRKVKNENDDWCPSHSVCHRTSCPKGHLLCEYEDLDSLGCKVETKCQYKGKNKNRLYCKGFCPPICSSNETLVKGELDVDECETKPLCIPKV